MCLHRTVHTNTTGCLALRSAKGSPCQPGCVNWVNFYLIERHRLKRRTHDAARFLPATPSLRPHARVPAGAAGRRNDRHRAAWRRRGLDFGIDIGGTDDAVGLRELVAQGPGAGAQGLRSDASGSLTLRAGSQVAGLRRGAPWRSVRRGRVLRRTWQIGPSIEIRATAHRYRLGSSEPFSSRY